MFTIAHVYSLLLFFKQTLDDLSSKVSTSCDEFLNILAECMDLNYDDSQFFFPCSSNTQC